jgi:adenine-specific DNA methylase
LMGLLLPDPCDPLCPAEFKTKAREILAEELREVGTRIKTEAEQELAEFYPPDPDGNHPIAYLWARTVRCEASGCDAEIPLMRSFWLSKKGRHQRALRYRVGRSDNGTPHVEFEIFEPTSSRDVQTGTVARAKARCLVCGSVLHPERVRAQLAAQKGGSDVIFDEDGKRIGGARLLAVVMLMPNQQGRCYRLPTEQDYQAIFKARQELDRKVAQPLPGELSPVPDEPLPPIGTLGFRVQRYGMLRWGDPFTARQKLALVTLTEMLREVSESTDRDKGVKESLSMVIGRCADYWSSGVVWAQEGEFVAHTFGRQALPIVWDFAEAVPWSGSSGNFDGALDWVAGVIQGLHLLLANGQAQLADACASPLPDASSVVWFTDPPYYDAVPYADLSDFFFVWLRRSLLGHSLLRDPFTPQNSLTPKVPEIVQDEVKQFDDRPKDRQFFEERIAKAFAEGRRVLRDDGVGCVVFAHKTTEGWEALLTGLLKAGWTIQPRGRFIQNGQGGFERRNRQPWRQVFTSCAVHDRKTPV